MNFATFLVLGLFTSCKGADVCAQSIFNCAEFKITGFMTGFHLYEKINKLLGVCDILAPYRSCIDIALKTCLDEDLLNPIIKQMLETRLLPHMVCDLSVWRKLYLEEAPCVNKYVSSSLMQCERESISFPEKAVKLDYSPVCKNLSGVILCQEKIMKEKCGYKSSELYKRVTMFKNPLAFVCHQYMKQQLEEDTAKPENMRTDYSVSVDMLRYIIPQAYYYVITQDPNLGMEFYDAGKGTVESEKESPSFKIHEDPSFTEDLETEPDDIFAVRLENMILRSVLKPERQYELEDILFKGAFGDEVNGVADAEMTQGGVPKGWMLEKEKFQKIVVKLPTLAPTFETSNMKLLRNHIQSKVKKTTDVVKEVWDEWKRSRILTESRFDTTAGRQVDSDIGSSEIKQNVPQSADDSSKEINQDVKYSDVPNEENKAKFEQLSMGKTRNQQTSLSQEGYSDKPLDNAEEVNIHRDESVIPEQIMSEWTKSRFVSESGTSPQKQFNVYVRHNLQKEQAKLRRTAFKEEKAAKSDIPLTTFVPFYKNSTFDLYHVVYGIEHKIGCGLGEFTWMKHRVSFQNLLCGWATESSSSSLFDCSVYFDRKCSFSPFKRDYVVGKDLARPSINKTLIILIR